MSCGVTIRSQGGRNVVRVDASRARTTNVPGETKIRDGAAATVNANPTRNALRIQPKTALVVPAVPIGVPVVVPVFEQIVQAQYGNSMVRGQVAYLANGIAYAVTGAMPQAVLNLLVMILSGGAAGVTRDVLVAGMFDDPILALFPGRVFLASSGFPSSSDDADLHYVPIGHSEGGPTFYFQPRERYFR